MTTDNPETLLDELENLSTPLAQKLDRETLRQLLCVSTATLDWSVLDRVESLVGQADPETWIQAMLEEMPRLSVEAPAWAVSLLGEAIENDLPRVQASLDTMPGDIRKAVLDVIAEDDFSAFYADSCTLLK